MFIDGESKKNPHIKMEQTEHSETLAVKIQTPMDQPEQCTQRAL
jgi:hypothetical protein